jgi:hypothetical protein
MSDVVSKNSLKRSSSLLQSLTFVAMLVYLTGCSMTLDISSKLPQEEIVPKTKGSEVTSGSNRQKTGRGYVVESQTGMPFGTSVSTTEQNYKVYHTVKMGTNME